MQSPWQFNNTKTGPLLNQLGDDDMQHPFPFSFPSVSPYASNNLMTAHAVELQSSEVCPKNFIIFDQTDYRSRIMFHPAIAHKFTGSGSHIATGYIQENCGKKNANMTKGDGSNLNDDSEDIDALLSLEEDDQEAFDEDEVSTARTSGNNGSNSSDSCSSYSLREKNVSSSYQENVFGSGSCNNNERKQQKMKKMMKALRGIVPGGEQMNTVAVIDEAVRYLKSLKVEAQKLGVGNHGN